MHFPVSSIYKIMRGNVRSAIGEKEKTGTEICREQTFGVRTCPPGLVELQGDIFGLFLPEFFA